MSIECDLELMIANRTTWQLLFEAHDAVLVFDDLSCTETIEFATLCKKNLVQNNLFVLIISRSCFDNFEQVDTTLGTGDHDRLSKLSYSVNEVYEFVNDGGINHWLRQVKIPEFENWHDVDGILVEDSKVGFQFFDNYFPCVYAASAGKSGIISDVKKLIKQHKKKLLVFVDLAAYGCHWEEFEREIIEKGLNVAVCPNRECFEQMLLYSNFFADNIIAQNELSDLFHFANRYVSWEIFFERLIDRASYRKMYRCTHSRHSILSECYLTSCNFCNISKRENCDYNSDNNYDKLFEMFCGTEFEKLLELPRVKRKNEHMEQMDIF